mmetsp:Transcript_8565/g.24584  ORF Transcript_8565/g.24584 Transcript_8565/m.24584 type:complete len:1037 (-) Transcript_8565:470-3580(-)|eukprot:CAMPEP_0117649330 /NCGR_PEP_ID=MMETSP0804-20121206/911_1 /TAXON_ID=1074897 /ORGANISM="Tetraselmis astigmatica, Strain CCMP880" /LENGTH=1036 /DNA_ID=CAMNT_0005455053 /DNA_START=253 /DNA_END=3363 /DNA_ORIENTATION=-
MPGRAVVSAAGGKKAGQRGGAPLRLATVALQLVLVVLLLSAAGAAASFPSPGRWGRQTRFLRGIRNIEEAGATSNSPPPPSGASDDLPLPPATQNSTSGGDSVSDPSNASVGTIVDLPIVEQAVLQSIRQTLTGEEGLPGWKGQTTHCRYHSEVGCTCSWEGVLCTYQDGYGWRVSSIVLASRDLQGAIPRSLSELQGLEVLNLAYNQLTGTLPPALSALTSLRTLYLHENLDLYGPLPPSYSSLSSLRKINLSGNSFSGSLPPSWHALTSTGSLDLSKNRLTGTLPEQWSSLSSLHTLGMDSNLLIGTLPTQWTAMVAYSTQYLEMNLYDNMLLLPVPSEFQEYSNWVTVNYLPQQGQVIVESPDGEENSSLEELEGFWEVMVASLGSQRVKALIGWTTALVGLMFLSCLWMFVIRRLRARLRRKRFQARCSALTPAERRYLEEHHNEFLMEHGFSGSVSEDALSQASSNPMALELAAMKRNAGDSGGDPHAPAGPSSNKLTASAPAPPPPLASLPEILALASYALPMPPDKHPAGGCLGHCFTGELQGMPVALKVVPVPEELCGGGHSPALVRRANEAAQRLQAVVPHPSLLPPAACAAVRNDSDGLRLLLVYKMLPGGSLMDWLQGTKPPGLAARSLPWPVRLRQAHEVAEGLVALGARGMMHGALHPGNVVMDQSLRCRLVHAGIAPLLLQIRQSLQGESVCKGGSGPLGNSSSDPAPTQDEVIDSPFLEVLRSATEPSSRRSQEVQTDGINTCRNKSHPTVLYQKLDSPKESYLPHRSNPHADPVYLRGGDLCPASDVYSLGVLLLQLLTGRPSAEGLVEEVQAMITAVGGLPTRQKGGSLEMSPKQAQALTELLDPCAGPWPIGNAANLLRVALSCTEARQRHRPDLKFHVVPRLASLSREASSMLPPSVNSSAAPSGGRGGGGGTSGRGVASSPGKAMSTRSDSMPNVFLCPITRELMKDPVVAADGFTYEREAIQQWIDNATATAMPLKSPMTNLDLLHTNLVTVHSLRAEIQSWGQQPWSGSSLNDS